MIIGITGNKLAGKDTIGRHLVHRHAFERKSFAAPLKKALAVLFDIPLEELEQHKVDDTVKVALGYENRPKLQDKEGNTWQPGVDFPEEIVPSAMWSPIISFSVRHLMQRFGTEVGRNTFGKDFWVDRALPLNGDQLKFEDGRISTNNIVVTDVRFENEAERIIDLGGVIIEVRRPEKDDGDTHESESGIPEHLIQYMIMNDSDFEGLYKAVDAVMENIYANASA